LVFLILTQSRSNFSEARAKNERQLAEKLREYQSQSAASLPEPPLHSLLVKLDLSTSKPENEWKMKYQELLSLSETKVLI
jgi:hypothetical protein